MANDRADTTRVRVTVELRLPREADEEAVHRAAEAVGETGFRLDPGYAPVPMTPPSDRAAELDAAGESLFLVRGDAAEAEIPRLEARPEVFSVWREGRIEPFG